MYYRIAKRDDIRRIAEINLLCVPNGNRQKWGINLVTVFFEYYYKESPLFIVAEIENNIVGYVMGYRRDSLAKEIFFSNEGNGLYGNNCSLHDKLMPEKKYDAVLYSLCVLAEYNNLGIGTELAVRYRNLLRDNYDLSSCCVETQIENLKARKIYEKAGYSCLYEEKKSVWYVWEKERESK